MNLTLQVDGKDGSYLVGWVPAGFSYAHAEVRELKPRHLWWPFNRHRLLWSTGSQLDRPRLPTLLNWAEKAHPAEMKAWYEHAVAEYEAYARAWAAQRP